MKHWIKFFVLAAIILLPFTAAYADTNSDPRIIIRDPLGCPSQMCVPITGLKFTFGVPEQGFGILHFVNASGVNWHSLLFTETGVPAVDVQCSSNVFSCKVVALGSDGAKIVLTAMHGQSGITAGHSFEITLGCANGNCPVWPSGLDFAATANVPEPATLTLVAGGLGVIVSRRRRSLKR